MTLQPYMSGPTDFPGAHILLVWKVRVFNVVVIVKHLERCRPFNVNMRTQAYYAVSVGRLPGVYRSWSECKEQVHKFPNCKYKRFGNPWAAQRFVDDQSLPQMKQLTLGPTFFG